MLNFFQQTIKFTNSRTVDLVSPGKSKAVFIISKRVHKSYFCMKKKKNDDDGNIVERILYNY